MVLISFIRFFGRGFRGTLTRWSWVSVDGERQDLMMVTLSRVPSQIEAYYYPGNRSDYYVCRFGALDLHAADAGSFPIDEDLGWVEVWVYTGSSTSSPFAYVYDSDGNFYYVDLAIDGYVVSGPSTE